MKSGMDTLYQYNLFDMHMLLELIIVSSVLRGIYER